jgi:hypothetical protein
MNPWLAFAGIAVVFVLAFVWLLLWITPKGD